MTTVWKKVPRVTRTCACGCGVETTGTARRVYAKPYCKFKVYLQRKKQEGWTPQDKFNPYKPKENPLNNVIPFSLGEDKPTNWWKERFSDSKDLSGSI